MKRTTFLIFIITSMLSCVPDGRSKTIPFTKDQLYGTWRLTEVSFTDAFREKTDTLDRRKITGTIGQGNLLSFFNDNTSTILKGNTMEFYNTSALNDSCFIIDQRIEDNKDTLTIYRLADHKGYTFLEIKKNDHGIYKYVREYEAFEDPNQDPYHSQFNHWRNPATEFESRDKVLSRLANYLEHKSLLLASSLHRENKRIRLKNSEGILRIFDGGIGLKPEDDLSEKWLHTFYSDNQGINAYKHLNKHFKDGYIKYDNTQDWVQMNYKILDSLTTLIKNQI